MIRPRLMTAFAVAFSCASAFAAFTVAFAPGAARAQDLGGWINVSDPTVKLLADAGKKTVWPGETAGVVADRASGDVFMVVTGQGLWKSADRGTTFTRADGGAVGGRCETGYALNADPAGGRLTTFMLDGPCAMTLDGGTTWRRMKDVGRNWDYAAVDWSKPEPAAILAMKHESGGELYLTADAGKTWKPISKDEKYAGVGIFDDGSLVTTRGDGILRSADGGATWTKVSPLQPVGRVAVVFKGVAYWLGKDGLLVSKDRGLTWEKQGGAVDAAWGPMFGEDETHVVVAGGKGFFETKDAGKTWVLVAPLPPLKAFKFERPGWFINAAWDPKGDVFYASRMGAPTFKFERKKTP